MIQPKPWLQNVKRIHTVTEDKSKYFLRIDQNERIYDFEHKFFEEFLKTIKHTDLCAYPSTKEFIEKLGKYLYIDPSKELFLSNGSEQIIKAVFETFVNGGDEVITTSPCFPMYSVYAKLFNATLIKVLYDEELNFDISSLISRITDKTKLIIIANPNSPIGDFHFVGEFVELFDKTNKLGITVLIDEAYIEFTYHNSFSDIVNVYYNVCVARTFSKAMSAAGIRMGYLLGNKELIDNVSKWRHSHPINGIAARFGLYLLNNIDKIEEHIFATVKERDLIVEQLAATKMFDVINSDGNWIHFNTKDDNKKVSEILNSYKNISSRDGCTIPYDARKNWVRMTVGPGLSSYPFFKKILKIGE